MGYGWQAVVATWQRLKLGTGMFWAYKYSISSNPLGSQYFASPIVRPSWPDDGFLLADVNTPNAFVEDLACETCHDQSTESD